MIHPCRPVEWPAGISIKTKGGKDMKSLLLTYADNGGLVTVWVDRDGISFCGGDAYFCDGSQDYTVPVSAIREIRPC